jgi:hypothetical protein
MKKLNLLLFFWLVAFSVNAQQNASPTCAGSTTLSNGSNPNLAQYQNDGWFTYIPTGSTVSFSITNNPNVPSTNISAIDVYSGSCSSLVFVGMDTLSGSNDSTLYLTINGLQPGEAYYIHLYRKRPDKNTFEMNVLNLTYCGISYGQNAVSQNGGPGDYSGFTNGCMLNNDVLGPPPPSSLTVCDYTYSPLCVSQNTLNLAWSATAFNAGSNSFGNAVFYVFSAGATFSVQASSTGTAGITMAQLMATGQTQFTIVTTGSCTSVPLTPQTTINDILPCSCTQLVIHIGGWAPCTFNLPSPICAGQPFCMANQPPTPASGTLSVFYGISPQQPGGTLNGLTGCLPNGLPAGQYTLNIHQEYLNQFGVHDINCDCSTNTVITVYAQPSLPNIIANPSAGCAGQTVTLTVSSLDATGYTWQPGGMTGATTTVTINGTIVYTVTASNNGCVKTNTITVVDQNCCFAGRGGFTFNNITLVPFTTSPGLATPWLSLTPGVVYANQNIAIPQSGQISGNFASNNALTISTQVNFVSSNFSFGENAVVNQNATTSIDRSYWHACTKNWQGVKSTQYLNVTNSVIEDAANAISINAQSGPTYPGLYVDNTIFNKNYVGINLTGNLINSFKVTGSIFTSRDIPVANYLYTSGLRWTQMNTFNSTALAAYSIGYLKGSAVMNISPTLRGQVGIVTILAQNVSSGGNPNGMLTIGDVSNGNSNAQLTNIFDYLRVGVQSVLSRNNLYNNLFQYISFVSGVDPVGSISAANLNSVNRTNVGNNANGQQQAQLYKNTFLNSSIGVYATNNGTLSVTNNQFTNITQNAVDIEKWYAAANNNQQVTITDNNFNTCLIDFYAYDNSKIDVNFSNNVSTYPFITIKPKVTYHTFINEINKPQNAKYSVLYNNSVGKVNGVYCINSYEAKINNNIVTVRTPIGTGFNAPIWLDNTDQSDIKVNTLKVSPSNSQSFNTFGIFTNIGQNNTYCENDIKGAGSAMKFQGPSPSKIYRNYLNNNPTDPCVLGIFLDQSGFVGPINYPLFGNLIATANNQFGDFTVYDTYVQNGSLGSQIDYQGLQVNSNLYYPVVNGPVGFVNSFVPVSNNFSGPTDCGALQQLFMQNLSRGIPPFLNNQLNFGGNNANANAIASKSIYELFRKNAVNTSSISGAPAFMAINSAATIGSFFKMDSLVQDFAVTSNTNLVVQASAMNTAITANSNIEQNQKDFNTIYHTYLLGDALVTPAQINTLKSIAALCPFTDGTNVYQARALLRHYDTTEYFNACEYSIPSFSSNRLSSTFTELNSLPQALNTKLFPNPASTEVIVRTDLEGASLLIYTVVGQLVLETTLTSETKLDVSEFKNGTYLYKIVTDKTIIKTDKLIINK